MKLNKHECFTQALHKLINDNPDDYKELIENDHSYVISEYRPTALYEQLDDEFISFCIEHLKGNNNHD